LSNDRRIHRLHDRGVASSTLTGSRHQHLGARNLAMGYLAPVIRTVTAQLFPCAGGQLLNGCNWQRLREQRRAAGILISDKL
jgi:hypothetical protein